MVQSKIDVEKLDDKIMVDGGDKLTMMTPMKAWPTKHFKASGI